MPYSQTFEKRIAALEKELASLREEWEKASLERRSVIEIEGKNKKAELRILQQVVKNRAARNS